MNCRTEQCAAAGPPDDPPAPAGLQLYHRRIEDGHHPHGRGGAGSDLFDGHRYAVGGVIRSAALLFKYFKQLFAQVTNPPIDPIREELVMSLTTSIGPKPNLMDEHPESCRRIRVDSRF